MEQFLLDLFSYTDIERFSYLALEKLKNNDIRSIVMTMHGIGFGLDETASIISQMNGLSKAIAAGKYPKRLEKIDIIFQDYGLYSRIKDVLDSHFSEIIGRGAYLFSSEDIGSYSTDVDKEHIFVAMPFERSMDDTFYFGIQAPIHSSSFLCVRIDGDVFCGDIFQRIKERIDSSIAIIADVTGGNANVYLEIGYAWGVGKPVILVCKKSAEGLKFDIQGQKCIFYENIKDLGEQLLLTIQELFPHKK